MATLTLILLSLCSAFGGPDLHCNSFNELDARKLVVTNFSKEVGQREQGGNNHGPAVKKYLASVNLGEGYAWCAAFVKYVYAKSGIETGKANAWSPSWFPVEKTTFRKDKKLPESIPRPGDVFGLYYPNLKRIGHVGFIEDWGNFVTTVEGNTNDEGSREGDGVYRKKRLKNQIYAVADWIALH